MIILVIPGPSILKTDEFGGDLRKREKVVHPKEKEISITAGTEKETDTKNLAESNLFDKRMCLLCLLVHKKSRTHNIV